RNSLKELGYVDGTTVQFEYRYAEGRNERFRQLAADLVASNVDIIVTWGTDAALEAKRATKKTPIVMGAIGDPIAAGVVTSLARPGGNITGLSALTAEAEEKRLDLLRETVPNLSRVAILVNPTNRYTSYALPTVKRVVERLQMSLIVQEAVDAASLDAAL